MKDIAPIVAQAEAEDALPGLGLFVQALRPAILNARMAYADARIAGWAVARSIFEYAARAEVQAFVKALNKLPDGKVRPGRPKTAHGLIMDHLEERGIAGRRSMQRWVYEWYTPKSDDAPARGISLLLKLKPDCSEKEFHDATRKAAKDIPAFIEGLVEKLAAADGDREQPDEAEEAQRVAKRLSKFFVNEHGERVNPKALKPVVEALQPILELHGYEIHKVEKAKK